MILTSSTTLAGLAVVTCFLSLVNLATSCTDTVYVGTFDGQVAISKDGGDTWRSTGLDTREIYSITTDGDHVYAGTRSGFAVSHDGGNSWTLKNLQPSSDCASLVRSVFVNEEKHVYALIGAQVGCGRVAISADNGNMWSIDFPLPNPPFVGNAHNIYIDGPRIYVATNAGLAYTDDLGTTWTVKDQSSGLASNDVKYVIGRGETIYAGVRNAGAPVSISNDDGRTWETVNTTPVGKQFVESMYLQDNTLDVATDIGGLSFSHDFVDWTWMTDVDGLASNWTTSIVAGGNNLYLGTVYGLSVSRDQGQSWINKTIHDGLPSDWILSVCVHCV